MNSDKITKAQRAYLDSLVCQRISRDQVNKTMIENFENHRNPALPYALQTGWSQDKTDKVAYYLVKEPGEDGEPLLLLHVPEGHLSAHQTAGILPQL